MKTIIVDIDNTIADISHRLKYIINEDGSQKEKKDGDKFFDKNEMMKDKPRYEVGKLLNVFVGAEGEIKYVTGRPEKTRTTTLKGLARFNYPQYYPALNNLLMRPDGDHRDDDILKKELTKDLENVAYIFEDRPRVIKMYREQFPTAVIIDTGHADHFKDER